MDSAAGMKTVGVGRNPPHGVHADWSTDHTLVPPPGVIGPWPLDDHFLGKGGMSQLGGNASDSRGRDTHPWCYGIGCVLGIEVALSQQVECGTRLPAVG